MTSVPCLNLSATVATQSLTGDVSTSRESGGGTDAIFDGIQLSKDYDGRL